MSYNGNLICYIFLHEVSPTPVCAFAADCALVNCSPGIAVDENGCPLRDCPCQDSIGKWEYILVFKNVMLYGYSSQ